MDEETNAAPVSKPDPKLETAAGIYTSWRNTHLNNLPVEMFNRLEAVSEHLITEIAAHL